MKFKILHDIQGRMRIETPQRYMTLEEADQLEKYLSELPGVRQATVHERTCNAIIIYNGSRSELISGIREFHYDRESMEVSTTQTSSRSLNRYYQDRLVGMVLARYARKLLLPAPIRNIRTVLHSLRYIGRGLRCIMHKKLEVEVLDALSIGVSVFRRDFSTAGSVMFLLKLGELLEEWTRKKSLSDLARCMSLNVDRVWLKTGDTECLVPISQIKTGDLICVHTGNVIPLDGRIAEGEVGVNQASLTGESLSVRKSVGACVYAGTVVEEGECVITVEQEQGASRYDQIAAMIETSEKLKSSTENRALALADKLVPYSLAGTVLTWLITRDLNRATSILMVDFSCALKLSMPLAVLSAMRECGSYHITVKGGKFLEAVAKADTIVFDKTGTLTRAVPTVADVVPFGGRDKQSVLRIAACLEEHYPHSMANAVVKEAVRQGIHHDEMHSEVEYVVAHGIASRINGKKVIIGSHHFVFEDESCTIKEAEQEKFDSLPDEYSHLYLAIGGELAGVICISDPLRDEASEVLESLRKLGISKAVMMTGDNEKTAAAVAHTVGVDAYFSEVLPEDKARFVEQEKAQGRTVIMIGDGINDSPALSAADVGIAISDGAAIAREIADVVVAADDLHELVTLKAISNALFGRINANYRFVLGFNGSLIVLGALGVLPPATSALLHNVSTLGISLRSMTNVLK